MPLHTSSYCLTNDGIMNLKIAFALLDDCKKVIIGAKQLSLHLFLASASSLGLLGTTVLLGTVLALLTLLAGGSATISKTVL